MSEHDIEFLTVQTRKLERAGIVLGSAGRDRFIKDHQKPKHGGRRKNAGRKRIWGSNAERCRRYRRRKVTATRFSSGIH